MLWRTQARVFRLEPLIYRSSESLQSFALANSNQQNGIYRCIVSECIITSYVMYHINHVSYVHIMYLQIPKTHMAYWTLCTGQVNCRRVARANEVIFSDLPK